MRPNKDLHTLLLCTFNRHHFVNRHITSSKPPIRGKAGTFTLLVWIVVKTQVYLLNLAFIVAFIHRAFVKSQEDHIYIYIYKDSKAAICFWTNSPSSLHTSVCGLCLKVLFYIFHESCLQTDSTCFQYINLVTVSFSLLSFAFVLTPFKNLQCCLQPCNL